MPLLRAGPGTFRIGFQNSHLSMPGLWPLWSVHEAASGISAKTKRSQETEEKMAHRKLTLKEQLKGVKAALRSRRTPPQLKEGLRRRKAVLEKELGKPGRSKKTQTPGFLGVLGL